MDFEFLKKLGIKQKTIGLITITLLTTIFIIISITLFKKKNVSNDVGREIDELSRKNLAQISQGVYNACKTSNDILEKKINYDLNVAEQVLKDHGGVALANTTTSWNSVNQFTKESTEIALPKMMVGDQWLGKIRSMQKTAPVVDQVFDLVGGTCTIFQRMNNAGDMLRVATNVEKKDRTRAIGTYIPATNPDGSANKVVATVLNGQTYRGRAYVVNAWYLTAYKPIKNDNGKVIGILYVGVKQENVETLRNLVTDIDVGKDGYVFVLGGKGSQKGQYIISNNGERDGENIWEARDSEGHLFIQSMVKKALELDPAEVDFIKYAWNDGSEKEARTKLTAFKYFEEWDWVIGANAYLDEFQSSQRILSKSLNSLVWFIIIGGFLIFGVSIFLGNKFTDRITNPIISMSNVAKKLSKGDINQNIEHKSDDEVGILADSFRDMIDQQKEKAAVANKLSEGDLDFDVPIESEKDVLGKAFNNLKNIFTRFTEEMEDMAIAHREKGDVEYMVESDQFDGAFKEMIENFNNAISFHVGAIMEMLDITKSYAEGDFSPILKEFNGKAKIANKRFNLIRKNLLAVTAEFNTVSQEAQKGKLDYRGKIDKFEGDWKKMIDNFNRTLDAVIDPLNVFKIYLDRIAEGDLEKRITVKDEATNIFQGEFEGIKDNINKCMDNIQSLVRGVKEYARLTNAGEIEKIELDESIVVGEYREIFTTLNQAARATVAPLIEILEVMGKMEKGDMTVRVKGDYNGSFLAMKNTINNSISAVEEILLQVESAVNQVSSASDQVASGSQELAEGSNEQASSLQEVSSTLEEMSSMVQQNSDNANQANRLSDEASTAAQDGSKSMLEMEKAIQDIKESSDETSKIVKTIDDIAFQTNLLALNAAVEAARAGEAGQGFAVVAEEVRNLAQRSAEAAKNTSDMIQQAIENAENGVNITEEMAEKLDGILNGVDKVNDLIGEIDAATKEQADGIEQVNDAVAQMNKVTQENASNSEESASAAEELNSQAEELSGMVKNFKLSNNGSYKNSRNANSNHKKLNSNNNGNGSRIRPSNNTDSNKQKSQNEITPEDVIPLDEDEMKDF